MYKELSELLRTVESVGVKSLAILPSSDGVGSDISGANDKLDVIIFDSIPFKFSDDIISIYGVSALLSRLCLFNQDKDINLDFVNDGKGEVSSIEMKQGRRKATFHCYNYKKLPVPKSIPEECYKKVTDLTVTLSKDSSELISSAIGSMTAATPNYEEVYSHVSLASIGGDLSLSIFDGGSDNFNDIFDSCGSPTDNKGHYSVSRFRSVLKESIRNSDSISVCITEAGTAVFPLGNINVILMPKD